MKTAVPIRRHPRIRWVVSVFSMLLAFSVSAQGIDFFQGTFDEALKEAQKRGVMIFVDAYTTWCGPCRRMSADVFPQKEVGDFYNSNFINMKIDMERPEGVNFQRTYPVRSFPTFLFIAPDGEVVHRTSGARPVAPFIVLGEEVIKMYDGSAQYQVRFDAGERDYEVVYGLVAALNRQGKSSLRIANDYLNTQTDLRTPENLLFILEAFTQIDSRIYVFFEEYYSEIGKLAGSNVVEEKLRYAASRTASRAVEFERFSLIDEAHAAMEKYLPDEAAQFLTVKSMAFALNMRDADLYLKHGRQLIRKPSGGDDADKLYRIASEIVTHFGHHKELLDLGARAAKMSVQLKDNAQHNAMYATVLFMQGDKKSAVKILDQAINRLQGDEADMTQLKMLRRQFAST